MTISGENEEMYVRLRRKHAAEQRRGNRARVSAHRPAALLSFELSPPPSQRRAISPVIESRSPRKDGWERHMFLPPQPGRLPASMSSIDSDSVTIASLERLENNRREGGRKGGRGQAAAGSAVLMKTA